MTCERMNPTMGSHTELESLIEDINNLKQQHANVVGETYAPLPPTQTTGLLLYWGWDYKWPAEELSEHKDWEDCDCPASQRVKEIEAGLENTSRIEWQT